MTPTRARIVLIASFAALAAIGLAATWWPEEQERADLRAVASMATTSTNPPAASSLPPAVSPPNSAPPPTTTTTVSPDPVEPVRIRIGSIALDAPVVSVGLAPDGQMEVPPASDVGWYRLGPKPGADGSAVMAAHVDYGGERGAFFDLRSVPVGAEVIIDGTGGPRRFVVTTREQIAKADIRLDRYFTAEGPARLTLITCGGAFDRGAGRYQDNLVITAEPAGMA